MLRTASLEERNYYERTLYPLQDEIFSLVADDRFYLSGGTCLSRFYYHHRYSDDIDLFFDAVKHSPESFPQAAQGFLARLSGSFRVETLIDSPTFVRALAYRGDRPVKMELICEPLPRIGRARKKAGLCIDDKKNIAVNKITTLYGRKTVKDYIDLFYLLREYDLADLIALSTKKVVPLAYEELLMLFSDRRLEGEAVMAEALSAADFGRFTEELIAKVIDHARSAASTAE